MNKKSYLTNCVDADGCAVNEMKDTARGISFKTICRHIEGGAASLNEMFGTSPRLCRDWAVSFHKSRFEGRPCVYVRHSGIEYIFA
jgi:hypothetical protein